MSSFSSDNLRINVNLRNVSKHNNEVRLPVKEKEDLDKEYLFEDEYEELDDEQ